MLTQQKYLVKEEEEQQGNAAKSVFHPISYNFHDN